MNGGSSGSYLYGILCVYQDVVKWLLFPVVALLLNTGTGRVLEHSAPWTATANKLVVC